MAEIARLGMAIDATGVSQMRQELQAMARTAAEAARSFGTAGGAIEGAGDKIGNAAGGFYAFEQGAGRAHSSMTPIAKSLAHTTIGMLDLGAAGNAATHALQGLLTLSGPMVVAFAAIAASTYVINKAFKEAREQAEYLADQTLKKLQAATENLKLDQSFRQQLKVLQSLDPEIETIRQKYELMGIAAEKNGADQETLGRIAKVASLEQSKLVNDRLAAVAKEQQAIQGQITALQYQSAAMGASAQQTIGLTADQKLDAIATSDSAKAHSAKAQELANETIALAKLQEATARINEGRGEVGNFQSQFGVKFDFSTKQAGDQLSNRFAATFEAFKDDPRAQGQLNQAFGSLVTQAIQQGVPDIPELLVSKIGSANYERLRSTLDEGITGALDATIQSGQQWGETFRREFSDFEARSGQVGGAIRSLDTDWANLSKTVATGLAANLDNSQPKTAIQEIHTMLDGIPAVTYKSVVIQTYASGSPTMPFSDYFGSYLPGKIGDIDKLSPEVLVNVPDLAGKLSQISAIQSQIAAITSAPRHPRDAFSPGVADYESRLIEQSLVPLRQESSLLQAGLLQDIARAQGQGSASTGTTGGGGSVSITINIESVTQEVLDRQLLPKFEQAIKEATGKDVAYRVLN